MIVVLVSGIAAAIVGLFIGWTGVAGFLLPILFMNYCRMSAAESLFLAFSCFLIGGILGAARYRKEGLLDISGLIFLSVFSLIGSALGALLNGLFREESVKLVLYFVVLVSGFSIIIRTLWKGRITEGAGWNASRPIQGITGLLTALLCALTGAGGPVLLMPILILMGMDAKRAVAAALFNSVFIAIPSIVVYASRAAAFRWNLIIPVLVLHGTGIWFAASHSEGIRTEPLKMAIAVFSIVFAIVMLMLNVR